MKLTDESQDSMDYRPLGWEAGITLSPETEKCLAESKPACEAKKAHLLAKRGDSGSHDHR